MSSVIPIKDRSRPETDSRQGARAQAIAVLSLIEARTAGLLADRSTAPSPPRIADAREEPGRADPRVRAANDEAMATVSRSDLERTRDAWRELLPDDVDVRVELVRTVCDRYGPRASERLGIADALWLDATAARAAAGADDEPPPSERHRHVHPPADGGRRPRFSLGRMIDSLPPFWTAFALTLTETVGAGALALPIAFATIGPLAGVALLVLLGAVNLLTVSYLAEASARNGPIRYGSAFVGRLAEDYLGAPASILLRVALFIFCSAMLVSYYTGFASVLGAVSGWPAPVWASIICGIGTMLVLRKTLLGTLTSALVIGAINLFTLVTLSLLALGHASAENPSPARVPYAHGQAFEPSELQLAFGVVLVSYFGHLSVSNCAQTVLRRDPGGRSLKRGTAAAMVVAIAIYALWSVSVGSALGGDTLSGLSGTVLVPLAEAIGPEAYVLGVMFAVLGLGMSSVHYGLGIVNLSRELLSRTRIGRRESRAASLVAVLPILLVFGYVQWTYLEGTSSFTAPLKLLGAIIVPVLAGIFPVLLLAASRAQGLSANEARVPSALSNPVVTSVVVGLSFAALLMHGLAIRDDPHTRLVALGTVVVMVLLIGDLLRRGAFSPVVHVEILRYPEDADRTVANVSFNGRAATEASGRDGSRRRDPRSLSDRLVTEKGLRIALPQGGPVRVRINGYTVSSDFEIEPLEGLVDCRLVSDERARVTLDACTGSTAFRVPAMRRHLLLRLRPSPAERLPASVPPP